jgi:DNA adenine methylase
MSRGGLGGTFSWSSRIYGAGIPGEVHGWLTALEELPKINDRFRFIGVCNLSAVDIIKQLDGPDTLFYLDPPYPKNTRVFKNAYKKEMNADDHRELGATLASIQGKAIISSYSSPLYDELFSGWRTLHQEIPNHSSQEKKKEKKVETIWMNF